MKLIKNNIVLVVMFLCSYTISPTFSQFFDSALSAEIVKVQGKKVIISDPNNELELKSTYEFRDQDQKIKGKVKVMKRDAKTRRVLGMVVQGKAQKKYTIEVLEDFDFTKGSSSSTPFAVQKGGALRAYGGMFMGTDYSSHPLLFGGDYSWYLMDQIKILVGGHYWFANEEYTNVDLIEINAGAAYSYSLTPSLSFEFGARLGMSMLKATFNIAGKLVEQSDSSLTISPLASVLYQFNSNWSALAELRKPIFMNEDVSTDGFYVLGGLEFLW